MGTEESCQQHSLLQLKELQQAPAGVTVFPLLVLGRRFSLGDLNMVSR